MSRLFPAFVRAASGANVAVYRLTGGRVGGRFRGAPALLLTTTGRRTAKRRTTPLLYLRDGDRLAVVASFGGSPTHPGWYRNLVADPRVEVELGRERRAATARTASPEERERLWPAFVAMYGGYARYAARTRREIPVVLLEPDPDRRS